MSLPNLCTRKRSARLRVARTGVMCRTDRKPSSRGTCGARASSWMQRAVRICPGWTRWRAARVRGTPPPVRPSAYHLQRVAGAEALAAQPPLQPVHDGRREAVAARALAGPQPHGQDALRLRVQLQADVARVHACGGLFLHIVQQLLEQGGGAAQLAGTLGITLAHRWMSRAAPPQRNLALRRGRRRLLSSSSGPEMIFLSVRCRL